MILGQEIVELMSFPRIAPRDHAQARKLPVAHETSPPHDERVHDWLRDAGQFRERAPQFGRRDLQNLGLLGFHPGAGQRRRALEHGDVADEIARARCAEDLLGLFAFLENLDLAAQDDR